MVFCLARQMPEKTAVGCKAGQSKAGAFYRVPGSNSGIAFGLISSKKYVDCAFIAGRPDLLRFVLQIHRLF